MSWPTSPITSYPNEPNHAGQSAVPLFKYESGFPRASSSTINTGPAVSNSPVADPTGQPTTPGTTGKPHQCRFCGKTYMHESTKCRHEKEHWNSYACPEPGCEVVSQRKDSMKRHIRSMHGKSGSAEDERAESSKGSGYGRSCE